MMSQTIEVRVPDLGDIGDVPVIEVLARPGARVVLDETLLVLETEKATMDVPSSAAGTVREVLVKAGDRVSAGDIIALVEVVGDSVAKAQSGSVTTAATPPPIAKVPQAAVLLQTLPASAVSIPPIAQQTPSNAATLVHASPSVRHLARQLGVDLAQVSGTGPKGRVLSTDVEVFVKHALSSVPKERLSSGPALDLLPWPQVDFAKFGPVERTQLSKIKRISGANLSRNSIVIPHVTNFDEADITELEEFRISVNKQADGKSAKLTMLAFLIKASVHALKLHPTLNASLDGDDLVLKRYFHIGFAADTPNGLVVPVIRDADTTGLNAIAAEAGELAALARGGKLKPSDMQGGCFTISSLGGVGGTGFTPIINAPELAILGAAKAAMKPVWDGSQFRPRLILPLTLSWDHRVIDGAEAARFLVTLANTLADFRRVSL
jgi:pyruvate dehydrogenase E2 component (dihydrolipoamide acetyltransferase)